MKKLILILITSFSFGQVGIGTTTPDNSASLDITSTNKGVLIPRVSLTDVNNTSSPVNTPATGLMVWNTNTSVTGGSGIGFYFFNGTVWVPVNTNTSNTLDGAYDQGGAGAGRTIIADAGPVKVEGTDGFWVTGTHGSGTALEAIATNSKMFFFPKKSAFRAGFEDTGNWSEANLGNYSAAFGRNTLASGDNSFAAGETTSAIGVNSAAFGSNSLASGNASIAFGNNTFASGINSFVSGSNSVASGTNAIAIGGNVEAHSFSEVAIGNYNSIPAVINSATSWDINDRVFSIGYGSGSGNRRDALEVFKNGQVRINNSYNLPLVDGTTNQVMVTDGSGNITWQTQFNNLNISTIPMYAANTEVVVNTSGGFTSIPSVSSSITPSVIRADGSVQIKVVIFYTNFSGSFANMNFRVRAFENNNATNAMNSTTFTNTTTSGTSGILQSAWTNWNGGLLNYQVNLQSQFSSGASLTIANAYILIKAQ